MQKRVTEILLLLVAAAMPGFASRGVLINRSPLPARSPQPAITRTKALTTSNGATAKFSRPQKFASLPAHQASFNAAVQIPAGGSVPVPTMGDFNGDGKKDVVSFVTTQSGNALSVLLGNGDGTFTQQPLIALDPSINFFFVGDLNGDGKDDIVVANGNNGGTTGPATLIPFISNGDGTFTQGATFTITTNPLAGTFLLDVNGDGKLDFLAVDQAVTSTSGTSQNVWTLLGDGRGGFQTATSVGLSIPAGFSGLRPDANMIMDNFDGNFPAELVGADNITGQLTLYLASANGVYVSPVSLATSDGNFNACFSTSGDLNGDHKPEIVSANCGADTLTVYANNGNGGFSTGTYYDAGVSLFPPNTSPASNIADTFPDGVAIADVNGDGINDLISTNGFSGDVTVLLGQGNDTFTPPAFGYATGTLGTAIFSQQALVADFNGDGKLDILVSDDDFSLVYLQGKGDGSFTAAHNYYSGIATPNSVTATGFASGDFNGDGLPDFVVGNFDQSGNAGITVFLSNPDGSLQPGVNYGSGGSLFYVVVGDFNGDGILDIAVSDPGNGVVDIFTGNPSSANPKVGDGTFTQSPATFSTGSTSNSGPFSMVDGIVAGDFNRDGQTDLAVVNNQTGDVGVLINNSSNGNVSFANVVSYTLIGSPAIQNLTAADANGDGVLDLVISESISGQGVVAILPGVGDGTFSLANASQLLMPDSPSSATVGDVNGDGIPDLAVTLFGQTSGNGIAVALGSGNGAFGTPILFPSTLQAADSHPTSLVISDINGDGIPDLVFTNQFFGTVGILYGAGNGNFSGTVEFPVGGLDFGLTLADVNGDGNVDVVTGGGASEVTVLLNAATPAITGQTASTTSITSSLNPATLGQAVTFTATVSGTGSVPTGNVNFNDGNTLLGSASLNANGVATFSTSALAVGTHGIVAQYRGDITFQPSSSQALSQVVNQSQPAATPDYTLSANPSNATIQPGSSAAFTITLTPINGYNGTVTLACGQLPAGVTCAFSTGTLTPANNQVATSTLTIKTTSASSASLSGSPVAPRGPAFPELLACITGMGLFGFVLMEDKNRKRSRWAIVLGVVTLIMILGLVGCGGGTSSSNNNNNGGGGAGTPAGSYAVHVTANGTAGSNGGNTGAHNLNLTVTVQ
jgi:hypothetical protein